MASAAFNWPLIPELGTGRSKTLPGLASHLNWNRRSSELVIDVQWESTKDFKTNALN